MGIGSGAEDCGRESGRAPRPPTTWRSMRLYIHNSWASNLPDLSMHVHMCWRWCWPCLAATLQSPTIPLDLFMHSRTHSVARAQPGLPQPGAGAGALLRDGPHGPRPHVLAAGPAQGAVLRGRRAAHGGWVATLHVASPLKLSLPCLRCWRHASSGLVTVQLIVCG